MITKLLVFFHTDGQFILKLSRDASQGYGESQWRKVQEQDIALRDSKFEKGENVSLNDILAAENAEHHKLFRKALKFINTEGRVPPSDLWEYQVSPSNIYFI